jgi:hypothetical protein
MFLIKELPNSTNITVTFFGFGIFIKSIPLPAYATELRGYKSVSKVYAVPTLLLTYTTKKRGYLAYSYLPSVGINKGLLLDELVEPSTQHDVIIDSVIAMYRDAFLRTKAPAISSVENPFLKDRIPTRMFPWYGKDGMQVEWKSSTDASLHWNNRFPQVCARVLQDTDMHTCVLSQCDPSDLNITRSLKLLDYQCGGLVSIEAELASFFFIHILCTEHLGIRYNPRAYSEHNIVTQRPDIVTFDANKITHKLSRTRMCFVLKYFEMILTSEIVQPHDVQSYRRFSDLFFVRSSSVFNLNKLTESERESVFTWAHTVDRFNDYESLLTYLHAYEHFK